MLLAKFKGIALGLTAAVMTTGVVLAQYSAGWSPQADDRLSVLERKLDRILQALGGSQRNLERAKSDRRAEAKGAGVHAGGAEEAAKNAPDAAPIPSPDPKSAAPDTSPDAAPKAKSFYDYTSPDAAPKANQSFYHYNLPAQRVPYDPTVVRGKGTRNSGPPVGSLSGLAARVDALEHRLAELERRFNEMENSSVELSRDPSTPGATNRTPAQR